jgi:hypothetical protein
VLPLAAALPLVVPCLVVSARPVLIALLLHAVARHPARDRLVEFLFILVKRPEPGARWRGVAGLQWLLHQLGWISVRLEEEVLPQYWGAGLPQAPGAEAAGGLGGGGALPQGAVVSQPCEGR